MSNLPGESSLKSIESGFANFKTRKGRKKNKKKIRAVKEQAFAKSKTIWIFTLVCELKKSREHILAELPDRFPDKLEILAERIHVLDTLRYALQVQDKDNEQRLESELGIRILEKENEQLWEGLESEFSSIMTLCDQLNQKLKHLHDVDDTGDSQLGAIDMANGLFHALDKLDGLLSRLFVKTGTSSLKSIESGCANFETRAVCKKNRTALEPVKEHASAKSETNWVFDLIVKLKKIEEHIRKELLRVYGDELEKLKEFIRVLEKLEHELKVEHKENGKLWEGLESEFSSMMTLCDQLNEKFEHLHDAVTARERLIYEDDSSDSSDSPKSSDTFFDFIMLVRSLGASGMVLRLFNALDKLDDLCSRLVSSESTVGNCDKGLQKLDIEKVDYNENKVPSRTFRGKRMSTPIEDKGDKGLQKLDIENVKVDYNENKVPSRTFKGKRMSTPIEDKENNVIDIKSHDILVEQLEIAKTSKIPVVMLFYSKEMKTCRDYLPKFDDLPNQYRHFNGDIKFFRVGMECAATEFKVRAYPTVLVLMPGSCGLQVVGRLSIEETVIVPAFVKALKTLLDERLWEYCGYMGALQQV